MPRCSICSDPPVKIAVESLSRDGAILREIGERTGRSKSAVHRHLRGCIGQKSARPGSRRARVTRSPAGSVLTPAEALERSQQWLDRIDELIFDSPKNIDRGVLLAIQSGVNLLNSHFKNAGWVAPDGAQIHNDNRQLTVVVEKWSTPAIRLVLETMSEDEREAALEFIAQRRALPC